MPSRPNVAARSIFYVYFWVDPKTGVPFYVGKGMGDRAYFKHRHERCQNKLNKLLNEGYSMKDIVVMHKENLTEDEAYTFEEQCIASHKRVEEGGTLFNYKTSKSTGYRKIVDPAVMEKIHKLYFEDGMNAKEVGKIIGIHETSVLRWIRDSGRQTFHKGLRNPFGSDIERNNKICEEYMRGITAVKIAKLHKCCLPTVLTILRRGGIEVLNTSKKSKMILNDAEVRKSIIEMYNQRISVTNISKKYKTANDKVKAVLIEAGVKIRRTKWEE